MQVAMNAELYIGVFKKYARVTLFSADIVQESWSWSCEWNGPFFIDTNIMYYLYIPYKWTYWWGIKLGSLAVEVWIAKLSSANN